MVLKTTRGSCILMGKRGMFPRNDQLYKRGTNMYDITIIGAGVTGCAVARELSKYDLKVLVLERASDVCEGTSKANSGIVHAGYDAKPGTLKASLNVRGNILMEHLSEELDFPFKRNGSMVLSFDDEGKEGLQKLYDQGQQNKVKDLRIISGDEAREIEPSLSSEVVWALYAPMGGIVCPFNLTIALAENASVNGVEFRLGTAVSSIEKASEGYLIKTDKGDVETRAVVNAAGVYAAVFHNMVSANKINITPRKGEYCLFDKNVGTLTKHTLFQLPTKYGKGVLVTPTVHGNLLVGPNAVDIDDFEGVNTTSQGLSEVLERGALSVGSLPTRQIITSFAGLRAHEDGGDFIIGQPDDAPGFFDAAGIESPGLSCAPAIGEYISKMILKYILAEEKKDFIRSRKGIPSMALADASEKEKLIKENPLYANVVCRCELVTEGEIMDAIHRPLGATTLDGIKRRTRAGMGRCQAGFCSPRTVEILARELGKDISEIGKKDPGSEFITGYIKG